jgi:hypothetical protein
VKLGRRIVSRSEPRLVSFLSLIYDIQLLEDGRALFTVVEDDCERRARWLIGDGSEPMIWTRAE